MDESAAGTISTGHRSRFEEIMTSAETSEYAQFSAEKVQRGLEIVQDTIGRAEDLATAENVQRGIDFVQDKIERAEELASSEKVQRGIDFIQDKIERTEDLAVLIDDIAIVNGTEGAKKRRCSRRGLILGGVIVVGVIVAVVVIRSRSHETAAEEAQDTSVEETEETEETTEDPS